VYPSSSLLQELKPLTTLLPPQEITPLTIGWMRARVVTPKSSAVWTAEQQQVLGSVLVLPPRIHDDDVLKVWPARTESDLAIRRSRFRDVARFYFNSKRWSELVIRANHLLGFDYITVCNVLWAAELLSTDKFDWWNFYVELGAFEAGSDHFAAVAKQVNSWCKKYPVAETIERMNVVECAGLTGYRNLPFPGFDAVAETQALAHGGEDHGLERRDLAPSFLSAVDRLLAVYPKEVSVPQFQDFVLSGDWATAGASSVGRVEWSWDDDAGSFKARKNLVPEVVDLNKYYPTVEESRSQVNYAIIKSELSKVRVAVASDLPIFLKMEWLTRWMNHAYKDWPGSTIEEDVVEQTRRQRQMWEKIRSSWNLPFDFEGFDHQPTTLELVAMFTKICRTTRSAVPLHELDEYDRIVDDVLTSFTQSTLSTPAQMPPVRIFKVLGGLMSGLRWTTLAGNAWNLVMSTMVRDILSEWGLTSEQFSVWLRGDDSAISSSSYAHVLLFRVLYEAIGARGADGKFGVLHQQSEFLRLWYSPTGLKGYMSRSVPSIVQRKPWNPEPLDDATSMSAIRDALYTIRRRGGPVDKLDKAWASVKQTWSQEHHLSQVWLQIPLPRGLGVEPWDGETMLSGRLHKLRLPQNLKVVNSTGFTKRRITKYYSSWMPVSESEAELLAHIELVQKVAADDVPAISSAARSRHKREQKQAAGVLNRRLRTRLVLDLEISTATLQEFYLAAALPAHESSVTPEPDGSTYGRHRATFARWKDVRKVLSIRGLSVFKWAATNWPSLTGDIIDLERRGLTRSEAVGWLFGEPLTKAIGLVHPALYSVLNASVVRVMSLYRSKSRIGVFSSITSYVSQAIEKGLALSALQTQLYAY